MVKPEIDQKPDLSELDRAATIQLHEAVTWLAFGEPGTAAWGLARHRNENDALQELIDKCLDEASLDQRYSHFPRSLPFASLDSLLTRLGRVALPQPPSTQPLLQMADQLMQDRSDHADRYALALHRILEAARADLLELFGRPSNAVSAPVWRIPLSFLRSDTITMDWSGENLGHVRTNKQTTRKRAIIAPTGDLSKGYYKVEMNRVRFIKWHNQTGDQVEANDTCVPTTATITRWYIEDYVPVLLAKQTVTTQKIDIEAARDRFPNAIKLQPLIAELRRTVRPPSIRRSPGRPKN